MAQNDIPKQLYSHFCGMLPVDDAGNPNPRGYRREFDFTAIGSIDFDLATENMDGTLNVVQAVKVLNQDNANKLFIEQVNQGTRDLLVIPKNSIAILPFICGRNPKIQIRTTIAALVVVIHFLNVPIAPIVWVP